MQTVSISSVIPAITEKQTTSEDWRRVEPLISADLSVEGFDFDPANLPEIFAKAYCGESANGKGMCFIGRIGSGKSSRMDFFARKTYIKVISAQEACATWVEIGGDQNITAFRAYIKADGYESRYSTVSPFYCDLIIDDLGAESEKYTCFGAESDVMVQYIIPARYNVFPRWKTHFTTNLTKDQLKERYGERCFSRLNEMCAFIPLKSGDRRMGR